VVEPGTWRKSSYSGTGNCVEWMTGPQVILVRNSNNVAAGELQFTHSEWIAFVQGVAAGEANLSDESVTDPGYYSSIS
jgi:hypothetical protein